MYSDFSLSDCHFSLVFLEGEVTSPYCQCLVCRSCLTHKTPNITIAAFANIVDPDETAHYEPSHLDLQCFNIIQFILKVFQIFTDVILLSAVLGLYAKEQ